MLLQRMHKITLSPPSRTLAVIIQHRTRSGTILALQPYSGIRIRGDRLHPSNSCPTDSSMNLTWRSHLLLATLAAILISVALVHADKEEAHVAKIPMVCPNGTVQGINGEKCYRYFSSGKDYDAAEKVCEDKAEIKGSGQLALIETRNEAKLIRGIDC